MACIYYMFKPGEEGSGYIGQDGGETYDRIYQHVYDGYRPAKRYGAEDLVQRNGASGLAYAVFEDDNFGINQEVMDAFHEVWELEDQSLIGKLDLAEIMHIILSRSSGWNLSDANIQIGGQNQIKLRLKNYDEIENALTALGAEFKLEERDFSNLSKEITVSRFLQAREYQLLIAPIEFRLLKIFINTQLYRIYQDTNFVQTIINSGFSTNDPQSKKYMQKIINDMLDQWNNAIQRAFGGQSYIPKINLNDINTNVLFIQVVKWIRERFNKQKFQKIAYDKGIFSALKYIYTSLNNDNKTIQLKFSIPQLENIQTQNHPQPKWLKLLHQQANEIHSHVTEAVQSPKLQVMNRVKEAAYDGFAYDVNIAIKDWESRIDPLNPYFGNGIQFDTSLYTAIKNRFFQESANWKGNSFDMTYRSLMTLYNTRHNQSLWYSWQDNFVYSYGGKFVYPGINRLWGTISAFQSIGSTDDLQWF